MISTKNAAPRVHADVVASARAEAGMRRLAPVNRSAPQDTSVLEQGTNGNAGTTNGNSSGSNVWRPPS